MSKLLGGFILVVTILLLTHSVRADPIECTDKCVQSSTGYLCAVKLVYEYELTTCTPCSPGAAVSKGWDICQPPAIGGTCDDAKMQMKQWIYASGFAVCPDACNKKNLAGSTPVMVQGFPTSTKGEELTTTRRVCGGTPLP